MTPAAEDKPGAEGQVTLLRPEARAPSSGPGAASTLPHDLLEQVRGRLRLLALFVFVGFAFDPTLMFAAWGVMKALHIPINPKFYDSLPFQWANTAGALVSAAVAWVAGRRSVSPGKLLRLGIAYEIVICFVCAISTFWQSYVVRGVLPELTWVPAIVILFPLILPGPPRTMLVGAILAGAMAPLSLLVLDLMHVTTNSGEFYLPAIVGSALGVVFAYLGARTIYGLGRQIAAARELGSYRLEEKLGQGGMGEVWRGRHRMLARPAAIKVIRPGLALGGQASAFADLRRRFEREAQVTASLRSPHTVGLYDFGVASDGSFYYVMELLEGLDTETLVKRFGPLPAERVVHVLRQMCHSLSEADSRGLVHRDIKPANVFLCRYGEEYDYVKVLDFGLVKALDTSDGDRDLTVAGLTGENVIQGTPAFMAPEQVLGKTELDGRVDIYATGCVAYWLLTGKTVFTAATPMSQLMAHVNEPAMAPSTRAPGPVPPALDQLVLACLAKDPKQRPQTARALAGRLEEMAESNDWTGERARVWWEEHHAAGAGA